jgi:ATP synthase protein I
MPDLSGQILRTAAIPVVATAVVVVAASAVLAGGKGLLGAVFGVVLAAAFYVSTLVVLGRVSQSHPMLFMNVALGTYLAKIIVLGVLLVALQGTTAFDGKAFGWSILVSALVWSAVEIRAFTKLKVFYVDPGNESGKQP